MSTAETNQISRVASWSSIYADSDLAVIADAISVPRDEVKCERAALEAAAGWLRLDKSSPRRTPPSIMRRRLESIEKAGRKLLKTLEIDDPEQAENGPNGSELFDALVAQVGGEDRLKELCAGVSEIQRAAERESETEPLPIYHKGHAGNVPVNEWPELICAALDELFRPLLGAVHLGLERENAAEIPEPQLQFGFVHRLAQKIIGPRF